MSNMKKSKGEGSRGGQIIGHTRSGKPIYKDPDHPQNKALDRLLALGSLVGHQRNAVKKFPGWSADDHDDAESVYKAEADRHYSVADAHDHDKSREGKKRKRISTILGLNAAANAGGHASMARFHRSPSSAGWVVKSKGPRIHQAIRKSTIEGSCGSHVLSRTGSGRAVYASHHPIHQRTLGEGAHDLIDLGSAHAILSHPAFSASDHLDASMAHDAAAVCATNPQARAHSHALSKSHAFASMAVQRSVCSDRSDAVVKAEGARGGHIIGHTKSGKPIYQSSRGPTGRLSPRGIKGYSAQDHAEAATAHASLMSGQSPEVAADAKKMVAFHGKSAARAVPPSAAPVIQAPVAHHAGVLLTPAPSAGKKLTADGAAGRAMAGLDKRMSAFNMDDPKLAGGGWKRARDAIHDSAKKVHDDHFAHMSASDHFAAAQAQQSHAGTMVERRQAQVARAAHGAMAHALLRHQRLSAAAPAAVAKGYEPALSLSAHELFQPVDRHGDLLGPLDGLGDDEDQDALDILLTMLAESGLPLNTRRLGDQVEVSRPDPRGDLYRRPTLIRTAAAVAWPDCLVKYASGDDAALLELERLGKALFGFGSKPPKTLGVAPKPTLAKPPAAATTMAAPGTPLKAAAPPPAAPAAPKPPAPAPAAPKPPGNATLGKTHSGQTVWAHAKADSPIYRGFGARDHAQAANLHALTGNHDAAAEHRAMHAKLTGPNAERPSAAVLAARPRMGGGRVYRSLAGRNIHLSPYGQYDPQDLKLAVTEPSMTPETFKKDAERALGRLRRSAGQPVEKGFLGLGSKPKAPIPVAPPPAVVAAPAVAGGAPGKGEGSRGGQILGHTTTGKPIYAAQHANHYKGFSLAEHGEAVQTHATAAYNAMKAGDAAAEKAHGALRYQHVQAMQRMTNAPTIITGHGDTGLPARQRAARARALKPKKPKDVMGAAATQGDA